MDSLINNFLTHRITLIIEDKSPELMDPSIMSSMELVDYFQSKKNKSSGYKQPKYNDKNKKPIIAPKKEVLNLLSRIGSLALSAPEGKWAKLVLSKYKETKHNDDGFVQTIFIELMKYTSSGEEKSRKLFINFLVEIAHVYAIGFILGVKSISYSMILLILYMSKCENGINMFTVVHKKLSASAAEEKAKRELAKNAKNPSSEIITEDDFDDIPELAAKKGAAKKSTPPPKQPAGDNFTYVDDEEC